MEWGFMNAQGEVISTITTCKGGCNNDLLLGGFIFLTEAFYNILIDETEIARISSIIPIHQDQQFLYLEMFF